MANDYDEDQQIEQIKRWWSENWKSLVAGLVIGLGGIFGWQGYQHHQKTQAAQASQMFEDMKNFLKEQKLDEANAAADQLVKEYAGTPYAVSAALKMAQQDVEHDKLDDAAKRLQWVMDNSKDAGMVPLARLRLAKVRWQQQKPDDALKLLDADQGHYVALFDELRGDIKLSQGDRTAARAAYEKALQEGANPAAPEQQSGLQHKLDDLANAVTS